MGGDVDGDVSGDEAVWRDLIARYEMPIAADAADATAMPWPERENLQNSARDPSLHVGDAPAAAEPSPGPDVEQPPRSPGTAEADAPANGDRRVPGAGGDRTRVVRHANPVPRPAAADANTDEDEGDRYVPPAP